MKRYLVSIVIVTVVLAAAWTVFAQEDEGRPPRAARREDWRMFQMLSPEEAAQMREKWQNMSEQEKDEFRTQMREKWQNMSQEEKDKLRAQMGERPGRRVRGLQPEEQLKAIKTIEEQLSKLKAGIESMRSPDRESFRNLSEEERTKLRETFSKMREEQQTSLETIVTQTAILQGQPQPAENDELIIVSTNELKAIQELAVKENARETAERLDRIVRSQQMDFRGERQPRGPRPTMAPPPEGSGSPAGQKEKKDEAEEQ